MLNISKIEIQNICDSRLKLWKSQLVVNESTPYLLIGLGHNDFGGEIHICISENVDIKHPILVMKRAIKQLEGK